MTTITNHKQTRRQLGDQLDRLDSILETLDGSLKKAVSTAVEGAVERAVEKAVRDAVQGLVSEVLTNPAALELLRVALAPPAAAPDASSPDTSATAEPAPAATTSKSKPGWLGSAWNWVRRTTRAAYNACRGGLSLAAQVASLVWQATSTGVKVGVLGGVGVAAIAAYLARRKIAGLASAAWSTIKGLLAKAGNALIELPAAFVFGT
jgi:hypothetical protein